MTDIILIIGVILALAYAIYEQIFQPKLKGETKLSVELKSQTKLDAWILMGLIGLTIAQGVQTGISAFTLFLLGMSVLLVIYTTFFRKPRLLFKEKGFFFGIFYIEYRKIRTIDLAEGQVFVVDLGTNKPLLLRIKNADDVEKVVKLFGGYK